MNKYTVNLDFKRGPSFGMSDIPACSEQEAIERVKREAFGCGFTDPVKKVTARKQ